MSPEQAQLVMLDMLVRVIVSEAMKAVIWAAVFSPFVYVLWRRK